MSTRRSRAPIWTQPAPGSRRPRLTREQLAEAALRIADRDGFEALSMRRLADELGAGTMTLYHYVRTKDDLIALLDDAILGEVLVPDGELPAHWRPALAMIARRSHAAFARHPWALRALQGARFGPNGMRHFEQSLAAVAATGLTLGERMAILNMVDDFVFGHTFRTTDAWAQQRDDRRVQEAILEFLGDQIAAGGLPHIEAIFGGLSPAAAWRKVVELTDDEGRFEQGLEAMLDGIALRWGLPADPAAAVSGPRATGSGRSSRGRTRSGSTPPAGRR